MCSIKLSFESSAVLSIHASKRVRTRSADKSLNEPVWLEVKQTTSHFPAAVPKSVSGPTMSGNAQSPWGARRDGERLSKTTTSKSCSGTSVSFSEVEGHRGHSSLGGRKTRPWRCAAITTHSLTSGSRRSSPIAGCVSASRLSRELRSCDAVS